MKQRHHRSSRRLGTWFLLVMVVPAGVAGWMLRPDTAHPVARSMGQVLQYEYADHLPEWAIPITRQFVQEPSYQWVAATADLNQDGRPELLIAPAPRISDLFIPDTPLRLVTQDDHGEWQMIDTGVSCRPQALGSFLANGYWDLPCHTRRSRVILRWNGSRYRGA